MAGDVKIDTAGIGNLISGIGSAAKDIRAAITGKAILDPAAEAALQMKLAEIEQAGLEAQAKINEVEAGNKNIFVSGWRPSLGWTCSIAFFYSFIILPLANWIARVCFKVTIDFPALDVSSLMPLTFGMLGIVGARTAEKFKGVASK
jgi:hypothetical protein